MEEGAGVGRGADQNGQEEESFAVPRARIAALIQAISQYQDVYPVLQRGMQFLCKELIDGDATGDNNENIARTVESFVETGALANTVTAMTNNLDSPAFISSCFELLVALVTAAEDLMVAALWKTDIVFIVDKIVHNGVFQNEPACVQLSISMLSKLVGSLNSIENGLWTQLVSIAALAMLTNSVDDGLLLECLLNLELLFHLNTDAAVPNTSASVILKTLDQHIRQSAIVSSLIASPSVVVIFRISSGMPHIEFLAPILAAGLHHYQMHRNLDESHKRYAEKLIQQPLRTAVSESLTRLSDLASPPAESNNDVWLASFQTAAMKLLLGVVWREEARACLDSGGVTVLAKVFTSGSMLKSATLETILAQTLYYVSMHWPNETWKAIQVNSLGMNRWVEVISERCEVENDGLLHYLLAMIKILLHCEGFLEAFIRSNGVDVFQSVLHKHHLLPRCTRLVVNILTSVPNMCPTTSLPALSCLVAETMFALETNRSSQLECVKALSLLIAQQSDKQIILSSQHVRDIVRVMRSKLMDGPFIAEMLSLVVNTLLNASIRASFIDLGVLQVASKAICVYQASPIESIELNARWIVCDVAHKLDATRNLNTLEPNVHTSNGRAFNPQAISTEALDACCYVIGALSCVKSLLPCLIEGGSIRCLVGMLRYAKQELIVRSENSFSQLVMTCFYSLSSIVSAPIVMEVMGAVTVDTTREGMDSQSVYSCLLDAGADDAIIGCLEEALRLKKSAPLLADSGCRLLQAVLKFPLCISGEAESRWIAVATSLLQRVSTLQNSRELIFGTTLMVLSRRKRSSEANGGQHIKMMKVILELLENSIHHESSCTLLQAECTGAIQVLEEIAAVSDSLSDALVSRCLGVLGKLIGIFILSPSVTARETLTYLDNAIALFATSSYVSRLISRLHEFMVHKGVIESAEIVDIAEDLKALEALLFSSRTKTMIDSYHRLFGYLVAVVEDITSSAQYLGDHAPFFLELGCLTSQLLLTAQREEVINTALCHFTEDTAWHSMRWIAALADGGSSEFTLIVEFVLLRIVSGYTILEPALLMELLDALNYLLHCNQYKEILVASSHARELQSVLWELVYADVAHMDTKSDGYDVAVSLLGIISSLISSFSGDLFSIQSEKNGGETLVRFCLGALNSLFLDTTASLTKLALIEEALQTTSVILQHCIQLGAEYAQAIIQHGATRHLFNISVGAATVEKRAYEKWCVVVLGAVIQSHGLLYGENLLRLSSNPSMLLVGLIDIVVQDTSVLSWSYFVDYMTIVNGSVEAIGWKSDCSALFVMLEQQTKHLLHEHASVVNSYNVKKHVADTIAQLSFKYGQLSLDTQSKKDGCLQEIVQSGFVFYELFTATPSIDVVEYSAVVSLHLKIARLVGSKLNMERSAIEESAVSIRSLLMPICISDEALADYLDFVGAIYLHPSIRSAAWLFINACTNVLSKSIQRLTTGLVRSRSLEKSIFNCFSCLRDVYSSRWENGEVNSVLELLKLCSPDRWSQEVLLNSIFLLPEGLLNLFELARTATTNAVQVVIMAFLFQHVNDVRHKTQRFGEVEISAILSMIKRNVCGKVGDTSQRKWREVTGSEMLRSALEALKVFARRKNCALVCSDLRGIDALYNVLGAPSQYEDNIQLALEICCYLASYGVDLTHESSTFALELLLAFVETNVNCPRPRLTFLVLEYFLAVEVSALSLPLLHQCRTQIVPVAARSYEEAEMFIQQLYIARQKLVFPTNKPKAQVFDQKTNTDKSSEFRGSLNDGEIRKIILSSCRSIVQCTGGDDENSYVDVKTSEKTVTEPLQYARLRKAIEQLSFVLDDPDMVMNQSYVSALVPALSEILVLHTITTAAICTIMQILDQIAFVNPSVVLSNEQLDIRALMASCSLHHRSSLPFAQHLCRFCSSIAAELRAMGDDDFGRYVSLVSLVFELLHHWKSNGEIIDLCLATAHDLIGLMRVEQFNHLHCGDVLTLFNVAVIPYTSNNPTSWNWLKCMLAIFNKINKVTTESAQAAISIVLGIIQMFMSHSFMVEKALVVLVCVYRDNRQLPFRHLMESDGVEGILTCLRLHANDESIVRSSLRLLVGLVSLNDTSNKTIDQLLTAAPATPILLVSKKHSDNPLICGMCIELLYRLVGSFEDRSERKNQMPGIPGGLLRKKSELLTQLLETDIIPLVFDLLDNYSSRGDNFLLRSLLELLNRLTKDERLCESAEVLHGLHELQQTIDRVLENKFDCAVVELAIDILVNIACSEREIGHGWRELPLWLLQLAETIHNLETDTGMCVEKLIGILGRLAVDSAICKTISAKGSFTILELLAHVEDRSLEQALYGLLCTLCEDVACAQIFIVYDAIRITTERMICHVDDEDTLLNSLCFLDLLVLNSGESYGALQDEAVFEALELVTQTYPGISGGQVYHIASTILEKLSALDYQSTRTKTVATKVTKVMKLQFQISDSEKPFHDLLCEGGKFRVLWEARPDEVETIQVKLTPRGDYLLFKRKASSQLPRVERVFVSQLEVCPQRSLIDQSTIPLSPSNKVLAQALLREKFEGDRVLRLKVRDEDVLIKTSSTRERVYWDQALQWLVSHRKACITPTHLQKHF